MGANCFGKTGEALGYFVLHGLCHGLDKPKVLKLSYLMVDLIELQLIHFMRME